MLRVDALRAIHERLADCVVVTIMGAVAAELQAIGHRPNHFYLQHAMGLASSMGLGIALARPELARLAGVPAAQLQVEIDHHVRSEGTCVFIDGDAMVSLGAAREASKR